MDNDRPTNPGLEDRPTNPSIDLRASASLGSDDVPTDTELDHAIELLRVSIPPAEAGATNTPSGTMSPEAIDSVARFISDPALVTQNSNRDLDAPGRTLAALELLDAPEYGAEPTDMRAPPQPPPTPGSVRPSMDDDLPSIVLSSQVSTRADQTERTRAIPATHPLANSIAPGGSAVSTPPRPRKSSRWQITLGVAALLAIGFGSVYLQSRGEHHAASGLPGERQEEEAVTRRGEPKLTEQELVARQVAEAEAARQLELAQQAEAARLAEAQRLASEQAARDQALAAEQALAAKAAAPKKARSLRIAMGGARMLEREQAEPIEEGGPNRAQIVAAMNAMTEQLKGCVGDEHGVADVTLTVRAPGVVSHALVEGSFADSPQGTCIARALRTAKMPSFADPITRIEYPFQL
ncbi:MAG TPA: hypothetical protein VFX59_15525 [Polyangiales bacterium]|nr:hypothetical protein [Polyangiales bacterium]